MPVAMKISNNIDIEILRKAIYLIKIEYPILNSYFYIENGIPKRKVKSNFHTKIEFKEMISKSRNDCLKYLEEASKKVINIKSKELMKVILLKRDENEYYLMLNIHHIIFDGSSIFILIDKILNNYVDIYLKKEISLNIDKAPFDEFTQLEEERIKQPSFYKKKKFWEQTLKGYKATRKTYEKNIKVQKFKLEEAVIDDITDFCKERKITKFVFFYTLYKILLKKYDEDTIIGMPTIQRSSQKFDNSIGYFVNIVPLKQRIDFHNSFNKFIESSQTLINGAIANSDYPFRLINRDYKISTNNSINLIQKSFSYQNYIERNKFNEYKNFRNLLSIEILKDIHQRGEYELVLECFDNNPLLEIRLKYNENSISKDLIKNFEYDFISSIKEILKEKGNSKIIDLINNPIDRPDSFLTKIVDNFENYSSHIAIKDYKSSLTYGELGSKVKLLKNVLQNNNIQPGDYVGILIERNNNIATTILSILSLGGVFIPIDSELPPLRIQYIIKDSQLSNIIVDNTTIGLINNKVKEDKVINIDNIVTSDYKNLNGDIEHYENKLAYLIYTSGTTGNPKGVKVKKTALNNLILHIKDTPGINKQDALLSTTSFGFDIFILELLLPLFVGAKCIIASNEKKRDPESLKQLIYETNPSIMQGTPSMWSMLLKVGWRNKGDIKILCGGEPISEALKSQLLVNSSSLWNMYGPTETTIWSAIKKLDNSSISIGYPISKTELLILDENYEQVNINQKGELYISGEGLAEGYHNLENLTKSKFIQNPYTSKKMFKTGDAAILNEKQEVVILGRLDNQVKLNGQRIELEEIENVIKEIENIENCITLLKDNDIAPQIICYYTVVNENIEIKSIIEHLKKNLPQYMIPKKYIKLQNMPTNSNGKIDRKVIKNIDFKGDENFENIKSNTKETISSIIEKLLNISDVDKNTGFFELGIDSIYSVELAEQINQKFNASITTTDIFSYSNINKLSEYIDFKDQKNNLSEDTDNKAELDDKITEDDIAIIGISCMIPGASNHNEFWSNLVSGIESIEDVPVHEQPYDTSKNYISKRFSINYKSYFDPSFFKISPKQAEIMDPQSRLLLLHAWKSIEDAGYNYKDIQNTSVYVSVSNNSYNQNNHAFMKDSTEYTNWLLRQSGTTATMISYYLNLKGASLSVHSNCSSSMVGIDLAVNNIRQKKTDYALVGASTIHSLINQGYIYSKGLNFSTSGHVSPFDEDASGLIGGEGVGVVLLKNARKAIEDEDNIYSIITESATNNDGNEKAGFYAPSVSGQINVIHQTMSNSENIDFIETHGTGTHIGDPIEVEALKKVYNNIPKDSCALGSVKANIGHLDTLSGLISLIKASLIVKNRIIPPLVNFKNLNSRINLKDTPFYINKTPKHIENRETPIIGGISSFGIGGTNAHIKIKEYKEHNKMNNINRDSKKVIIPISASDDKTLKTYILNLKTFIKQESININDISYTFQFGRVQMPCRAIFIVSTIDDLIVKLDNFLTHNKDDFENRHIYTDNKTETKAIELWSSGEKVLWSSYSSQITGKKISLPTYPFNLKSYKINMPDNNKYINRLHPFVHKNISTLYKNQYITNVTSKETYIADHIINESFIIPGVYYIECMRFAGEDIVQKEVKNIKNIIWKTPIEIIGNKKIYTTINYDKKYKVDISESTEKKNFSNCQAILDFETIYKQPLNKDINEIKNKAKRIIKKQEIYSEENMGIYNYGETFKAINQIFIFEKKVISELEVSKNEVINMKDFKLHPTILEGALQSITPLLNNKKSSFMPYSIKELRIFNNVETKMYAHVTESSNSTTKFQSFNIDICNLNGEVAIQIFNYTIGYFESKDNHALIYKQKFKNKETIKHIENNLDIINVSINKKPELFARKETFSIKELYKTIKKINKKLYCIIHLPEYLNKKNAIMLMNFIIEVSKYNLTNSIYILFVYEKTSENLYYKSLPALLSSWNKESNLIHSKVINYSLSTREIYHKLSEEFYDFSDSFVQLTEQGRLVEDLQHISKKTTKNIHTAFKHKGTYIVFGGNGSIGQKLIEYLVIHYNANIISVSRNSKTNIELNNHHNIKSLYCDINDLPSVKEIINYVSTVYNEINGIFHCAGIIDDDLLKNKSLKTFYNVINSKVQGTNNIDLATEDIKLDFMILFSSISSLGNRGQTDYAFGNKFLNNFAHYRNSLVKEKKRFGHTYSINWPIWEEGKMKPPKIYIDSLEQRTGMTPLKTNKGFNILETLLNTDTYSSVFIFYGNKEKILNFLKKEV